MKKKLLIGAAMAGALGYLLLSAPPGPRDLRVFDPDRLATLECDMWRAYYGKQKFKLFSLLVTMLREQYRLPYSKALSVAYHWAKAAAYFGDAKSDYEKALPDLEEGYRAIGEHLGAKWNTEELAQAELAWWVARRTPDQASAENVGRLIGELYARIYEVPASKVTQAGVLRAQAGRLRDQHGDWNTVEKLLRDSYRALHVGVS